MKIIPRIVLALVLAIGVATPSVAAKPSSAVTITFDADGYALPVTEAAADWSKNTGINVVTGDCTGDRCVHFKVSSVHATDCPSSGPISTIGGCAYRLPDGACQVEVLQETAFRNQYSDDLIAKHEAGHCVFSYGGKSTAFHLSDSRALMSANQPGSPSRQEATLTAIDRSFTKSLF